MPGILLFAADAFFAGGYVFVWEIGCSSRWLKASRRSAARWRWRRSRAPSAGLLLGRLIDAGHGTRAAIVALVVMAATTTLRAVSVGNAPLAVLANASGALVACLYVPVLGTAIYNQAKRSPLHAALPHRLGKPAGTSVAPAPCWLPRGCCRPACRSEPASCCRCSALASF